MTAFLESPRFPDSISYGTKGGPLFNTTVIEIGGGHESRTINWPYPKSTFDAAFGVRKRIDLYDLIKYFRAVRGKGYGFRFKDWSDFKSHHGDQIDQVVDDEDQLIGTGDTSEKDFQLIKSYTEGVLTGIRLIQKPIDGTVLIALDDVLQTETTHYTIDYTTGIITFVTAPSSGVAVTAGFEFDVPCRFGSDQLETNLEFYDGGSATAILAEIRVAL